MATSGAIPLFRPPDPEEVEPYKPETVLSIGVKGAPIPNATIFLNCLKTLVSDTEPKDILMIPRRKLDSHDAGWQAYVDNLKAKHREYRERLSQDMHTYYREQFSDEMVVAREQQKRERDAIFARQKEREEVEFVKQTGVKWKDYQQWVEHDKQKDKVIDDKDQDIKALNKNINDLQIIIDAAYRDKALLRGEIEKLQSELEKFKATDKLQTQLIQSHEKNANVVVPVLQMGPPMDPPGRDTFVGGPPLRGHGPDTPRPDGSFYHPRGFSGGMPPPPMMMSMPPPTPVPAVWRPDPQAMGPPKALEYSDRKATAGPAGPSNADNDNSLYNRPSDVRPSDVGSNDVRPTKRPASKSPKRVEKDYVNRIPNVDSSHTKHRRILVPDDKGSSGPADPPEKRDRQTQRADASNAQAKRTDASNAQAKPAEVEKRPLAASSQINKPAAPPTENRHSVPTGAPRRPPATKERHRNRPAGGDNSKNNQVEKLVSAAYDYPRVLSFTSAAHCEHWDVFKVICEGPLEYMKWDNKANRMEVGYIHPRDAEKVYDSFNHADARGALRKHYNIDVDFAQPNEYRSLKEETVRDILFNGASRMLCISPVTRSLKDQVMSEVHKVFKHDLRDVRFSNGILTLEFWDLNDAVRVKSQALLPSHVSAKYARDNSCWRNGGKYRIKEVWNVMRDAADDARRRGRR